MTEQNKQSSVQPLEENQNLEKFLSILHSHVSEDELKLSGLSQEQLQASFLTAWHMLQNRGHSTSLVEVEKIHANLAVLHVVSIDTPFIVDSILNEFRSSLIHLKLIVEPVIGVNRNNEGKIIAIGEKIGQNEAITQIYFSDWHTIGSDLPRIKAKIEYIMECVYKVFQDWQPICKVAHGAIDNIQNFCPRTQNAAQASYHEIVAFIQWLLQGNFVFLASLTFDLNEEGNPNEKLVALPQSFLGLLSKKGYELANLLSPYQITSDRLAKESIVFGKTKLQSVVHRLSHMEVIYIPLFDASSKLKSYATFIGFFSSAVYTQEVTTIPLIKDKIYKVLALYNLSPDGYNVKEMITALQSYPRTELFQMSVDELYYLGTALVSLTLIPRIKVFIRYEEGSEFLSVLLFIPKNRFSTDINNKIEAIICDKLEASVSKRYIQITDLPLIRSQLILKLNSELSELRGNLDASELEKEIASLIHRWEDNLQEVFKQVYSLEEAELKFNQFNNAFSQKYTFAFTANQAAYDLPFIEKAQLSTQYDISQGFDGLWQIRIYSREEKSLSVIIPSLQNLGLNVFDMTTYYVSPLGGDGIYIHLLHAKPNKDLAFSATLKQYIEETLYAINRGQVDDDSLNSLIVYSQMSWREVLIIRTYAKYLKQIMFPYLFSTITQTMLNNNEIAKQLIWFFYAKFGSVHCLSPEELSKLQNNILDNINKINSIVEDIILRAYLELINSSIRTNYFLPEIKSYISIKIASHEISKLPLPKPFCEIFVYSNRFEAIHLRGGKVARGGIRWSDRPEDFRTEVLGLMKAQMTKNSVIVPVGSKGGFVLKKNVDRADLLQEGIECYSLFLSGLLDITDNIIDGQIVHPKGVLCYDQGDSYLVVAADKGTASFSDYANSIAQKYNFWLDDAFASGGSAGYDHKKMAITSRGAWISVLTHLATIGIDIKQQTITAIGIGDMSGDVFGNGLLRSENIKLIAAFNHAHIFIDPSPDPKTSYQERLRLFNLSRSQWTDYDSSLISPGGGIFLRTSKNIKVTEEMRKALGLDAKIELATPDELITAILMAPADLLWNGGIGTYVKSCKETNEMIGDKANDAVRVNGNQLRCKVVGEGGNLGFTQRGRIEYSSHGGLINTDFIDNSGGVDCSDHEVNIKIAFSAIINAGLLTKEERNRLLIQMTDEIAMLVLRDNLVQNQLISLEFSKGAKRLADHTWLINHLEQKGELDRKVENLPDHEEIQQLIIAEKPLTRPAIAVLISYAKNSAIALIEGLELSKDEYMSKILISYFPPTMRSNTAFVPYLRQHKLAKEIIATMIVNDFINTMGCSFFHQLLNSELSQPLEILKTFLFTKYSLGIDQFWEKVEKSEINHKEQMKLFTIMQRFIARNMLLLLQRGYTSEKLDLDIINYSEAVKKLHQLSDQIIINDHKPWHNLVTDHGFAELIQLYYALDIINVAQKSGASLLESANSYYWLRRYLRINDILQYIEVGAMVSRMDYVSQTAFISIINGIDELLMKMALVIVKSDQTDESVYVTMIHSCCDFDQISKYNHFIDSLHSSITFESAISTLVLVQKHLQNIVNSCCKG